MFLYVQIEIQKGDKGLKQYIQLNTRVKYIQQLNPGGPDHKDCFLDRVLKYTAILNETVLSKIEK